MRKARSGRADANVAAWADGVDVAGLFLSVVSLQEIAIGVLLKERSDPAQGAVLRRWLEGQVVPAFAARTLPADAAVALRNAALLVPDPRTVRGGPITATALAHGSCVATRDVSDFRPTGVAVLDPWWSRCGSDPRICGTAPSGVRRLGGAPWRGGLAPLGSCDVT